jgi:hypothetical protein
LIRILERFKWTLREINLIKHLIASIYKDGKNLDYMQPVDNKIYKTSSNPSPAYAKASTGRQGRGEKECWNE